MHKLSIDRLIELMEAYPDRSAGDVLETWKQEHVLAMQEYTALLKKMAANPTYRTYQAQPPEPAWVQELKRDNAIGFEREDRVLQRWSQAKAKEDQARYPKVDSFVLERKEVIR